MFVVVYISNCVHKMQKEAQLTFVAPVTALHRAQHGCLTFLECVGRTKWAATNHDCFVLQLLRQICICTYVQQSGERTACLAHSTTFCLCCVSYTHTRPSPAFPVPNYSPDIFSQLEKLVLALVEESRKVPLPVTRDTIESFGIAARDKRTAAPSTSADDKKRLQLFGASDKWVRNFLSRNCMSSIVLPGEAGSLDPEAIAEGMEATRLACLIEAWPGKHLQRGRDRHLLQTAAEPHVPVENGEAEDAEPHERDEGERSRVRLHVHQRDRDR